jgi:hypothetical protein
MDAAPTFATSRAAFLAFVRALHARLAAAGAAGSGADDPDSMLARIQGEGDDCHCGIDALPNEVDAQAARFVAAGAPNPRAASGGINWLVVLGVLLVIWAILRLVAAKRAFERQRRLGG